MLFLCLLTVLGLVLADTSPLCGGDCPADWKKVEGDCVMFLYGWEELSARQVCRGLEAEYSEWLMMREDSDNATRHSLSVCLLSRETPMKALIISGGYTNPYAYKISDDQSVEVYVPSTGQHCQLPDLPDKRGYHSMEKMTVCGGIDTRTSCLTLTDAGWQITTTLLEERSYHSRWDSPDGVILLGGQYSSTTTEKILQDGTSTASFDLEYDI